MPRKAIVLLLLAATVGVVVAIVHAQESAVRSAAGNAGVASEAAVMTVSDGGVAVPAARQVAVDTGQPTAADKPTPVAPSLVERLKAIRRSGAGKDSYGPPGAGESPSARHVGGGSVSSEKEPVVLTLPSVLKQAGQVGTGQPSAGGSSSASAGDAVDRSSSRRFPSGSATAPPMRPETVGGDSEVPGRLALLCSGESPVLSVEAVGPRAIVVGKEASFVLKISNQGASAADDVNLRVALPAGMQVVSSQPTAGVVRREANADGAGHLIWTMDQLAARGCEQLTLAIASDQSRGFDLSFDWTCRPSSSSVPIEVRQPRLEMTVSGPKEILFGETGMYTVLLANPGTGDAENVVLTLAPGGVGESRRIGVIPAGGRKQVEIELSARQAGQMEIRAAAVADGGLRCEAAQEVLVRRANLQVNVQGPSLKFAGAAAAYQACVANVGDAVAKDVAANLVLPAGAEYVPGPNDPQPSASGVVWRIGDLEPGAEKRFEVRCKLTLAGENRLTVQAAGAGGLAAEGAVVTRVEAVADLKLTVNDPEGPVPVGEDVVYEIKVMNRGTKAAQQVNVIGQFSDGIEPVDVEGARAEIVPGQVLFQPVARIDPGQQVTLRVKARAEKGGNHVFRAEVKCGDPETRLVTEDSTRFFGDAAAPEIATRPATPAQPPRR